MYRSLKLRIYTYPYFYFYLYFYSYSASRVTPASMLRYVFSGFALPSLCFSSLVKKCFNLEEASIFCLSISTAHCVGIVLFFIFFFFLNYFFFFFFFFFGFLLQVYGWAECCSLHLVSIKLKRGKVQLRIEGKQQEEREFKAISGGIWRL